MGLSTGALLKPSFALLVCLSLGACSNSAPPYLPTPTSVPAPPGPQPSQDPAAREVYELPKRCAEDTSEWFKNNYSQPRQSVGVDGGGLTTIPLEYQNHFSRAKNACFVELSQLTSFKSGAHSKQDYIVVTDTVWDVKANAKLAAYEVKNVDAMTACEVSGVSCTGKEQWLEMVRPYLAE